MSTPDVTVIVPVYNTMPYLRATLDSLVDQTIGPDRLQVVTVDDGSTDGSGELLDEYAAKHPNLFTVSRQPNSGGPASPCNRGLELATGRYVFFLGADDYLGAEALDRLVTKADEWDSDVVVGKMVGVGGRYVNQKVYDETCADVPFPSALLALALANTKLFRRSVIEEHGIRYPLDLKAGSDQPFTIEAMLHARRISVLGDYDYYFAVKREDEQNITYTSTWRARLDAMTAIIDHIVDLLPPGEGRDSVLSRHFSVEVATLLRRDFGELDEPDQAALVAGVNALTAAYLTPGILPLLGVLARLRYVLAREGDLDALRALVGEEDRPVPVLVEGDDIFLAYPGFRARFPDETYADTRASLKPSQVPVGSASVTFEGSSVAVTAPADLVGTTVRLVVVRAVAGGSRQPSRHPLRKSKPFLVGPAGLDGGTVSGEVDLTGLFAEPQRLWALRLQVDIGSYTYSLPVCAANAASTDIRSGGKRVTVTARPDDDGRTLLDIVAEDDATWGSTLLRRVRRR